MQPQTNRLPLAPSSILGLWLIAISGCATAPAPVVDVPVEDRSVTEPSIEEPAPVEAPTEEAQTFPLPDEPPPPLTPAEPPPSPTPEAAPINSPAVVALVDQAHAQAQSGAGDQAAATLERALRIEPHNPWLWHRLAVLRLQQQRYQEAIDLATRSNSLAGGDESLLAGNREVIARCRKALGETKPL